MKEIVSIFMVVSKEEAIKQIQESPSDSVMMFKQTEVKRITKTDGEMMIQECSGNITYSNSPTLGMLDLYNKEVTDLEKINDSSDKSILFPLIVENIMEGI